MKSEDNINFFNISFGFSDQLFLIKQIIKGKSYMRATHNLFIKKFIRVNGKVADLGSGKNNDYHLFISNKKTIIDGYDFHKRSDGVYKVNLDKKFKLKKNYNHLILFNVFEHIYNSEDLILSISKSLKKKQKLEVFVPFMYRFHADPNDFLRPTHSYLKKILKKNGFKVKFTFIGTGQMIVILQILFKYLKFSPIKYLFSVIFSILNIFFYLTSKDFKSYYCGIHCSCIKK